MKRLGDAELEIMEALWNAVEPVTSTYVLEHLKTRNNWPVSTVMTVLANLADKGFVECDRSKRRNLYRAIIDEKEYKNSQTKLLVDRLYHNSVSAMLASLVEAEEVSQKALAELKNLIDQIGEK